MAQKYLYNFILFLVFSFSSFTVYSQAVENTSSSKPNESIEGLQLYPNPTTINGKIYISSNNNLSKEIGLYDILGKKIFSTTITNRELVIPSNINPGVYLIKIKEKDATATRKLVIR